jgi:hypothetical protein
MAMKCDNCGSDCIEVVGTIREKDPRIGNYEIQNTKYYECISCNERVYPLETANRLDQRRKEILSALIRKRPISHFMSASETAECLGITRQALHKHRRIRKGLIYQTELSGKTVYLAESVALFKKTGDGRFPLSTSLYEESATRYINVPVPMLALPPLLQGAPKPDLQHVWSSPTTDTAVTPIFSLTVERPEFVYPLVSNPSAAVVRERKDVKYA